MSKPTPADAGRTCLTCGATKTPVWRTGPTGPKTMCNRCGIKWMRRNPNAERAGRKRAESPSHSPKSDVSETSSSPELPAASPKKRRKRSTPKDTQHVTGEEYEDEENEYIEMDDEEEEEENPEAPIKSPRMSKIMEPSPTPEVLDSPNRKRMKPNRLLSRSTEFLFSSSARLDSSPRIERKSSSPFEPSVEVQSINITSEPTFAVLSNPIINEAPLDTTPTYTYSANITQVHVTFPAPTISAFKVVSLPEKKDMPQITASSSKNLDFRRNSASSFDHIIGILPSAMQCLDLSSNMNINCASLQTLPCAIQQLNLSKCKQLTDSDLLSLPPQVQTLNLSHCFLITDEALKHLPHNLQHLDISNCYNITDEGLKGLPVTLLSLNIGMCMKITDEGLSVLPPLLQKLEASGCKITNEGLKALPSSLRHLNLESCEEVTDEGLESLPANLTHLYLGSSGVSSCKAFKHMQSLRHLDLTQCRISDGTIQNLPTSLEWLNVFHCKGITENSLRTLPPHLDFVNFRATSVSSHAQELKAIHNGTKVFV